MHTIELGNISVTRIPHFSHWSLPAAEFLPESDPELWEANRSWLAPTHWEPAAGRVGVAVQSWLLRSAGATVIIDTGLAAQTARPGVPSGASLPDALAAAGVTPTDVDLVVCTHLHADHVGWNTCLDGGERVPAFPRARYLFSRPDLEFFLFMNVLQQRKTGHALLTQSSERFLELMLAGLSARRDVPLPGEPLTTKALDR